MKRPLLFILGVWMAGELLVHWAGLPLVPATSLDRAMEHRKAAIVRVSGTVCRIKRTSSGLSYCMKDNSVFFYGNIYRTHQLLVYTGDPEDLVLGYRVNVTGTLSAFDVPGNPGQFDARAWYRSLGVDFQIREAARSVESASPDRLAQGLWQLREQLAGELERLTADSGVMISMFLGDRSRLEPSVRSDYLAGGISHLLAVSGLHISLAGMGLYRLALRLGLPAAPGAVLAGAAAAAYVVMAGGSTSAVRALVMFLLYLLARLTGRTYDLLSALAAAALMLLFEHPLLLWQSGFQLSLLAVAGIGAARPVLDAWIREKKKGRGGILPGLTASLSVCWFTNPVTAVMNGVIPVYGVFLNLLALPFAGTALISAGTASLLGLWGESLSAAGAVMGAGSGCLTGAALAGTGNILYALAGAAVCPGRLICRWYQVICRLAERLPGHFYVTGIPAGPQLACYYVTAAGILWCLRRRTLRRSGMNDAAAGPAGMTGSGLPGGGGPRREAGKTLRCLFLAASYAVLLLLLHPPVFAGAQITVIDVGQGDSILVRTEEGCCLIDGGSSTVGDAGTDRILPFLKSQAVDHLDAVIVTHPDSDHYNGIEAVLRDASVPVYALGMSGSAAADPELAGLRKAAQEEEIPLIRLGRGDHWQWGDVKITCRYPGEKDLQAFREDKNDTSLVFLVECGSFSMLLTGDLGEAGEKAWMAAEELPDVTVLKAGHHGSRFSGSRPFLEAVSPEIGIISCGKNNRYGHPHRETLERLDEAGCRVLCTQDAGAVTVYVRDGRWKIYGKLP